MNHIFIGRVHMDKNYNSDQNICSWKIDFRKFSVTFLWWRNSKLWLIFLDVDVGGILKLVCWKIRKLLKLKWTHKFLPPALRLMRFLIKTFPEGTFQMVNFRYGLLAYRTRWRKEKIIFHSLQTLLFVRYKLPSSFKKFFS